MGATIGGIFVVWLLVTGVIYAERRERGCLRLMVLMLLQQCVCLVLGIVIALSGGDRCWERNDAAETVAELRRACRMTFSIVRLLLLLDGRVVHGAEESKRLGGFVQIGRLRLRIRIDGQLDERQIRIDHTAFVHALAIDADGRTAATSTGSLIDVAHHLFGIGMRLRLRMVSVLLLLKQRIMLVALLLLSLRMNR